MQTEVKLHSHLLPNTYKLQRPAVRDGVWGEPRTGISRAIPCEILTAGRSSLQKDEKNRIRHSNYELARKTGRLQSNPRTLFDVRFRR